jgi:CRP-like cAMP-binding protein
MLVGSSVAPAGAAEAICPAPFSPSNRLPGPAPDRLARVGGLRPAGEPRNALLANLPAGELERVRPHLERVPAAARQILQERNFPVSHAYFLERGAASVMSRIGSGGGLLEVLTVGHQDFVGIPIVLGTSRSPHRCIVQIPGEALRIPAEDLKSLMNTCPALRQRLLAYVQVAMVQSAQLVVCNARHSLRERVARWLLVAGERIEGDVIALTHHALGRALGVRRAGITTTIGAMEEAGLLRRERGRIRLVDRDGLEAQACDCHRVIRAEHRRLLGRDARDRDDRLIGARARG